MATILLLLDMQNLWDSCRAQYGKRARVDFKGLLEKAKKKKTDAVMAVAFIASRPDKNQDNLIKKLDEMGFATVTKQVAEGEEPNFADEMQAWFEANADAVETLVIAGGSKYAVSVLDKGNAANKNTLIIGFSAGVDKDAACASDDIKLLSKHDTIIQ
jgi:hypothetical protein